MKKQKKKHILTLFRNTKCMRLVDLSEATGHMISSLSHYERGVLIPLPSTVISLAKGLGINPDVLFYSFGLLPKEEMGIIMSDPFYYMDKIKKLCNNSNRKKDCNDEDVNHNNTLKVFNYISKESTNV